MTSYGAFVQIQDDIDGMVHVSDMSWTRKINHPSEVLQRGQEVEAVILDIDPTQQRISLGMRQLMDDPWASIEQHYHVGDVVEGKVTKLASFGAFVELANGVDGLIHISQLSGERVNRVRDVVNVGDTVKARVVKIDAEERRIGLSLKEASEEAEFAADLEGVRAMANLRPGEDLVDVGNVFDEALAKAVSDSASAPAADDATPAKADETAAAAPAEQAPAAPAPATTAEAAPAAATDSTPAPAGEAAAPAADKA